MNHLSMEVFEHNPLNTDLIRIIAANNSRQVTVSLESLNGYLECQKAMYPFVYEKMEFFIFEGAKRSMFIKYTDQAFSVTITETTHPDEDEIVKVVGDIIVDKNGCRPERPKNGHVL